MPAATALAAAGLLVTALAGSTALALAGTAVLAAGQGVAVPALGLLALERVPPARHGAASGLFFAFFDAGVAAGGPLSGAVAGLASPAAALAVSAGAVLGAGLLQAGRPLTGRDSAVATRRTRGRPAPSGPKHASQSAMSCSISSRSSSCSSQRAGIASAPSRAPRMLPVIAPVLSLSPEWLTASRTPAAKSAGDERAVDGDRERLLGDPAPAERA